LTGKSVVGKGGTTKEGEKGVFAGGRGKGKKTVFRFPLHYSDWMLSS